MIVWTEQGWVPAGAWNLPAEFQHPEKFAFTSDRAQFMLEEGGFAGYGAVAPRAARITGRRPATHIRGRRPAPPTPERVVRRGPPTATRPTTKAKPVFPSGTAFFTNRGDRAAYHSASDALHAWQRELHSVVGKLRAYYGGGQLVAQAERANPPEEFSAYARFRTPGGDEFELGYHYQSPSPATPEGYFFGRIQYQSIRAALASGYSGYGAANVGPMGWRRFRMIQGRSQRPMGYRGHGYGMATLTWDEYANRLHVP